MFLKVLLRYYLNKLKDFPPKIDILKVYLCTYLRADISGGTLTILKVNIKDPSVVTLRFDSTNGTLMYYHTHST